MSRIAATLQHLSEQHKTALIPFITAGDPHPSWTVDILHHLVATGCDILELGVPFSDPMADGPVIQRASERALLHQVSLSHVLDMVRAFRERDSTTPIVLMGYLNPVEVMGYETFATQASAAGVDGVLTVDMPPEESTQLVAALQSVKIDPIFLLAPTSNAARIEKIVRVASGYLYYVSLKGVTGSSNLDDVSVCEKVADIRQQTTLPIAVGFGIKDAATAQRVARCADAVIVGSALINQVEAHQNDKKTLFQAVEMLMSSIRQALDNRA